MPVTARAANFVRGYAEIGGPRLHYVETGARVELSIAAPLVAHASVALTLCQGPREAPTSANVVTAAGGYQPRYEGAAIPGRAAHHANPPGQGITVSRGHKYESYRSQ